MRCHSSLAMTVCLPLLLFAIGCASPYRADQGALFGGVLGAGTGAIVGHALGNTGAGAAIGAGVGALSGAAVGSELDEIDARNRAMIAQQLGREVAANAVTIDDVVAMTRGGVNEELIVNHVRTYGTAVQLRPSDLIFLQQQGVSARVIAAMQSPPVRPAQPVVVQEMPPPVVVEPCYGPYWGPPYYYHHGWYHRHRPAVSWGVSFTNR